MADEKAVILDGLNKPKIEGAIVKIVPWLGLVGGLFTGGFLNTAMERLYAPWLFGYTSWADDKKVYAFWQGIGYQGRIRVIGLVQAGIDALIGGAISRMLDGVIGKTVGMYFYGSALSSLILQTAMAKAPY